LEEVDNSKVDRKFFCDRQTGFDCINRFHCMSDGIGKQALRNIVSIVSFFAIDKLGLIASTDFIACPMESGNKH